MDHIATESIVDMLFGLLPLLPPLVLHHHSSCCHRPLFNQLSAPRVILFESPHKMQANLTVSIHRYIDRYQNKITTFSSKNSMYFKLVDFDCLLLPISLETWVIHVLNIIEDEIV